MAKAIYYVEAPNPIPAELEGRSDSPVAIFLAGGITGCPDWQTDLYEILALTSRWDANGPDLLILNPRRRNFPMDDPSAARAQITWEYEMLRRADIISFWFSAAQIQPIVLFEYGFWLGQDKPFVLGVEPGYVRRQDVMIQTELEVADRGGKMMHENLGDLCAEIRDVALRLRRGGEA